MRKNYLDNLRSMAVVLVVIYHVIYMYNGVVTDGVIGSEHPVPFLDGIQYVLYPWFMVILFMIAGMCSRYYLENHTEKEFLRSRTGKLLVPSTLGLLAVGWMQGYVNMSIASAFETISDTVPKVILYLIMVLSGTGVLWFIQVLWVNSLLLYVIRKYEKGNIFEKSKNAGVKAFVLCGIFYYISGLLLNTPVIAVYRFGIYGYTFFLGYFVLSHEEVIEKLSRYAWGLLGASGVLACVYLWVHFGDNYAVMPVVGSPSASAYGYVMSLALLGMGKKYWDKTSAVIDFINQRSFALYIFHYLPLSAAALYMENCDDMPQTLKYLLTLTAAFAGSFVLYEVIRRIPVLRFLILGMKKSG